MHMEACACGCVYMSVCTYMDVVCRMCVRSVNVHSHMCMGMSMCACGCMCMCVCV